MEPAGVPSEVQTQTVLRRLLLVSEDDDDKIARGPGYLHPCVTLTSSSKGHPSPLPPGLNTALHTQNQAVFLGGSGIAPASERAGDGRPSPEHQQAACIEGPGLKTRRGQAAAVLRGLASWGLLE